MRLTPLDIRKQEFKRGMRGLDADEVYAFLSTIADEYEAVINDNKALRERLLELDDKVQEYRNMEKTLRDTLLTAERVTVEAKENARRESDLIIKEAQIEAEKAVRDISTTSMKLRQEIQGLKRQRDSYLSRMKILVESHMKFVESAEEDFAEEEREGMQGHQNAAQPRETPPNVARREAQPANTNEILDRVIEQQREALATETDVQDSATAPPTSSGRTDERRSQTGHDQTSPVAAEERPRAGGELRPAYHNETASNPHHGLRPTVSDDRPVETQPVPSPASGGPGEWSLEKLKRDILGG